MKLVHVALKLKNMVQCKRHGIWHRTRVHKDIFLELLIFWNLVKFVVMNVAVCHARKLCTKTTSFSSNACRILPNTELTSDQMAN